MNKTIFTVLISLSMFTISCTSSNHSFSVNSNVDKEPTSSPTTVTDKEDDDVIITIDKEVIDHSYIVSFGDGGDNWGEQFPFTTKTGLVSYYFASNISSITCSHNEEFTWVEDMPNEYDDGTYDDAWYYLDVSEIYNNSDKGLYSGKNKVTVYASDKEGNKAINSFYVNVTDGGIDKEKTVNYVDMHVTIADGWVAETYENGGDFYDGTPMIVAYKGSASKKNPYLVFSSFEINGVGGDGYDYKYVGKEQLGDYTYTILYGKYPWSVTRNSMTEDHYVYEVTDSGFGDFRKMTIDYYNKGIGSYEDKDVISMIQSFTVVNLSAH